MREKTLNCTYLLALSVFALELTGCGSSASAPAPVPFDWSKQAGHSQQNPGPSQPKTTTAAVPAKDKEKEKEKDKDKEKDSDKTPAPVAEKPASEKDLQIYSYLAQSGELTCPFANQCEPSLVMISLVSNSGVQRCSGFLIGHDRIMTSDHCVSKNTLVQASCQGKVFFHFAAGKNQQGKDLKAATIECDSLVTRSHEAGLITKDYAIFKMKKPVEDRQPVAVATRGFRANESVIIPRVQMSAADPKNHHFNGVQNQVSCPVIDASVVYPELNSAETALVTLGDCPIEHGNSGSPVLNRDGEIGAVLQGFLNLKDAQASQTDPLEKLKLDPIYGPLGVATQMRCIPELGTEFAQCGIPDVTAKVSLSQYLEKFHFDARVLPELTSDWTWKTIRSHDDDKLYLGVPVCIAPSELRGFEAMMMHFQRGINQRLQGEWRSRFKVSEKFVRFNPVSGVGVDGEMTFNSPDIGSINFKMCSSHRYR